MFVSHDKHNEGDHESGHQQNRDGVTHLLDRDVVFPREIAGVGAQQEVPLVVSERVGISLRHPDGEGEVGGHDGVGFGAVIQRNRLRPLHLSASDAAEGRRSLGRSPAEGPLVLRRERVARAHVQYLIAGDARVLAIRQGVDGKGHSFTFSERLPAPRHVVCKQDPAPRD